MQKDIAKLRVEILNRLEEFAQKIDSIERRLEIIQRQQQFDSEV